MKKNEYYGYVYKARKVANNSTEIPARIADLFIFNGQSVVDVTQILSKPTDEKIYVIVKKVKQQFEIISEVDPEDLPDEVLEKFRVRIRARNLLG